MSERRTLLSRPRTRVYDCNYNIGEGYYKPMMDHLDRKYYGSSATKPTGNVFDGSSAKSHFGTGASAFDDYGTSTSPSPTTHSRRSHSGSDSRLSLADDDFEQEVAALRKARNARAAAARTASLEQDFESAFNGFASDGKPRSRLNYTEKLLDSVGLNSRSQEALEGEILKKRTKSFFADADDAVAEQLANNRRSFRSHLQDEADDRSADELAAQARARKSKARLLDIQNELDGIAERDAARQQRAANLKALFADNEALTAESAAVVSSLKKRSSKKVSF